MAKEKNISTVVEDAAVKPLPLLIREVIKAMEVEEARLKKEEKDFIKAEQDRLNKPPAVAPASISPLDESLPPLPPPKEPVVLEELEPEPQPERLSLEEDYPNLTVDLEETTSSEYRDKANNHSNQWYFDEYSGLYRQNASQQSQTSLHSNEGTPVMSEKLSRNNPMMRPNSLALQLRLSRTQSSHSNKHSRNNSTRSNKHSRTQSLQSNSTAASELSSASSTLSESWPVPTTVREVKELKKKVRSMRNRRKQLDLCRLLMDAACSGEATSFITESPLPGTPRVNTRFKLQELRNKKKADLMLEEVLVLEAQKILKRLAVGAVGNGTDGDAQFLLANCYGVGGLGLVSDRERASALFIHASKQNHIESTYRAGVCYELGIGTRKDCNRAIIYYRKAATLSHVSSMYKLAIIYLRGFCGQVKNVREAINWLQRAVALSNAQTPHALYVLAMIQFTEEFTENTNLIVDPSYGLELLHESARLDYLPSQVKLGELYEMGGPVEVDDAQSIYWYTKAAAQGNPDAALALSSWYLTGSSGILTQSDREAYLWARKAASYQYADRWTIAKAYFLVGILTEKQVGVSEYEDASIWFKKSAALGHRGALEMIYKTPPKLLSPILAEQVDAF